MSTVIRPELSRQNKYHIDRHRFYELKHFCLQYPAWKRTYHSLTMTISAAPFDSVRTQINQYGDPVAACAEARRYYAEKIELIENAARNTDPDIGPYILKGVTEGLSYDVLKARLDIPCCKDVYYDLYRRFFWLLHRSRN